jgi:hypothetical protein
MPTRNTSDFDRHPLEIGEKKALRTSTSTTLRSREPTNHHTAAKNVNFVFDHSEQMRVWPDAKPDALIETTRTGLKDTLKTMNKSGKPFALGVNVGGSPDQRGTIFSSKSPKVKITT